MKKGLIRKGLVFSVIVLFIGVTLASGIAIKREVSEVVKSEESNNELICIPVDIHSRNSVEHHEAFITQQEVEELDIILNDFETELESVKTIEETKVLFNDVIVSFNEFGLLPDGMNVKEAQQLVTGGLYNIKPRIDLSKIFSRFLNAGLQNFFCLFYSNANPSVPRLLSIIYGTHELDPENHDYYYPADGIIWTNGLSGIKEFEGKFKGAFREVEMIIAGPFSHRQWGYIGVEGFTGIKLIFQGIYFGFTIAVSIVEWQPYPKT